MAQRSEDGVGKTSEMSRRLKRAKAVWTRSAISIQASSRDEGCINRPDTRKHLNLRARISPTPPCIRRGVHTRSFVVSKAFLTFGRSFMLAACVTALNDFTWFADAVWTRVRTRRSQPEDDRGSEGDGREEGRGVAIVAGGDAPPILEAAEHDLDAAAVPVAALVIPDRLVAGSPTRDAWLDALCLESVPEPVGVIAAIAK